MSSFLNVLRMIVAILPAIVDLVQAIERAVPVKGAGSDKLELLQAIVTDAYNALDTELKQGVSLEGLLKAAAAITARLVALFNKLGWQASHA